MDQYISISEFREHLKVYLDKIAQGGVIYLTKRSKVIAKIAPEKDASEKAEAAHKQRLKAYRTGGIVINGDIVDQPLKGFDYIDDSVFDSPSIAAEPDAE